MAHFAEIQNGIVTRVLVVANDQEHRGQEFLANDLGLGGEWVQTSYNAATNGFRKHYAGIGYTYDPDRDAFYPPQPYPSWTLDDDCNWQPPTPRPNDDAIYEWNETNREWVLIGRIEISEEEAELLK